jgi:hypothetical protein
MKVLVQPSSQAGGGHLRREQEEEEATHSEKHGGPSSFGGFFETASHLIQNMVSPEVVVVDTDDSPRHSVKATGEDMISALRQLNSRLGKEHQHLNERRQARKISPLNDHDMRQEDGDASKKRTGKYVMGKPRRYGDDPR